MKKSMVFAACLFSFFVFSNTALAGAKEDADAKKQEWIQTQETCVVEANSIYDAVDEETAEYNTISARINQMVNDPNVPAQDKIDVLDAKSTMSSELYSMTVHANTLSNAWQDSTTNDLIPGDDDYQIFQYVAAKNHYQNGVNNMNTALFNSQGWYTDALEFAQAFAEADMILSMHEY